MLLSLIGGVATGVFIAITYVNADVSSQILPISQQIQNTQDEVNQQQTAIAEINTNLEWIKSALTAKGITPTQQLYTVSSTTYYGN